MCNNLDENLKGIARRENVGLAISKEKQWLPGAIARLGKHDQQFSTWILPHCGIGVESSEVWQICQPYLFQDDTCHSWKKAQSIYPNTSNPVSTIRISRCRSVSTLATTIRPLYNAKKKEPIFWGSLSEGISP